MCAEWSALVRRPARLVGKSGMGPTVSALLSEDNWQLLSTSALSCMLMELDQDSQPPQPKRQWWQHGEAVWWGAVGPEEKAGTPGGWWGQSWAKHANELWAFRPALVKANTAVLHVTGTRCRLGLWRRGWEVEVGRWGANVQAHWLVQSLCSLVCPILGAN
jgi:hypothetical protein